jgi:ATP-dependent DNA ligase
MPDLHPCLQLVEQTASIELARDWLAHLPSLGGVVAKGVDGRYRPGDRGWVKVKRQRTVDCVVVGFAGDARTPALVLALSDEAGRLRTFGATRTIPESLARPIQTLLARAGPAQAPIPSRWQDNQVPTWRSVPPELVCEVRFSYVDRRRWLRFPATLLRWRPDRSADECTLEQLSPS